ncbi:MAG: YidB family protein, partial [Methylocella sp.]
METFDKLIQEIGGRYCLGAKAGPFVQETLGLISGQPGGVDGFLNRLKAAGFAGEVGSWLGPDPVPLSGQEVEKALGSDAISEIANKVDVNQSFARTILGDAIPKIIVLLAQGGAVPSVIPAPASSFLDSAIPLSSRALEETTQHGAEQIRPSATEQLGAAPRRGPPRFKQLFAYGSYTALAVILFGFAWAAGSYFSGGQLPFYAMKPPPAPAVVPQESVERAEILRTVQKMAEDIQALTANVEALRAAQSQAGNDTSALDGLKTHLDAMKTETGASIADLAGKVEQMQREPAAKLSQVIEQLDRIEHQIAPQLATASVGAASASGKAAARKQAQLTVAPVKPPLETAHGPRKLGGRGDAFDPSQNPTAPGVPRPLGSLAPPASTPQLITRWVVRDVYNGIALVESPRGSIEVGPGESIPGAGTVKSIERRGGGWIVITSRGLIDSARASF